MEIEMPLNPKKDHISEQCQYLEGVSQQYCNFTNSVSHNLLSELDSLAEAFKNDAQHAKNENRLLRIGIIGQIKRGKSSFLNTLLFNGEDVLPKAATPMTAALTKISYSETPKALVECYSKSEWQKVLDTADIVMTKKVGYQEQLAVYEQQKYTKESSSLTNIRPPIQPLISDEEKACVELITMVTGSGINVDDYLGQTITLEGTATNEDLINQLNSYVGAKGQFTPIVKSTELHLNIEGLKDIEVVDTPGMNDPIISRGRRTQEFIGQCDVIFFLSYCGQFLDMHDMGLLAQNIPNKGIDDIVLIGSIFDGALLDECHNYSTIQQALPAIIGKLNALAADNVNRVCNTNAESEGGEQSYLMNTLQNALPPIFISARCFDLAIKAQQDYSEEEAHTLKQLNSMFEGFEFTPEVLKLIANFDIVENKLGEVRNKKEQILADRFNNLLNGSKREIEQKLKQIEEEVSYKRKNLLDGDVEALAKKQQAIVKRIESGKAKVANIFEKYSIRAEKKLVETKNEIQQDAMQAKHVESKMGSKEESYTTSSEVSDSDWYNPFSWGSTRSVSTTHYRTVNYTYANVQEAVGKLESFVVDTSKALFEASTRAISLDSFKQDIKASVKDMFDFSDDDFDPDMVLMPLSNAVERITIPVINLDLDKHINTIRQQFNNNEVEGDEISELRNEQARVVGLLLNDIAVELEACIKTMLSKLDHEEAEFVPSLTRDLIASVEQLKQDLAQKEQALATYDQVLSLVKQDLNKLTS
ncbi:MAG: hypothetical protein ACI88H_000078 [Cocleimonas sp.]|jgi:hypothetical protein